MDEIIIIKEKNKKIHKKCEHNKRKQYCDECGGGSICEHKKRKYRCKECGGSQICEHKRVKEQCKECGGSQICKHKIQKSRCKDCGGSQICEHNKEKSRCKDCGGSQICEHKRVKSKCKECGGSQICEHNKEKSRCKECDGSQICEHNIIKFSCKDCGGSQICEHKRVKSKCKDCKGGSICKHNKKRTTCRECGGSEICEHNIIKFSCKDCHGSRICVHNKNKQYCKECGGSKLCKSPLCETHIRSKTKYNGYCLRCCIYMCPDIPVVHNYKTKENEVVSRVKDAFPEFEWKHDKKVEEGCSRRRPDLLCDFGTHIVIIEVDENKHSEYDCSCENKRLMEISRDLGHRPIVFIRFNPDGYTNSEGDVIKSCWRINGNGIIVISSTKKSEWESRIKSLKEQIKYWIENPSDKTIEIIELFY
jgi:hypothetical protein